MQAAKLHLSHQQMQLVSNANIILTKNEILSHIAGALQALHQLQQQHLQQHSLPTEVLQYNGKISRGENYLGLPWLVLDHPRHFQKHNIFAVRSFFWWGKFFSTTLHLSGTWQNHYRQKIQRSFSTLQQHQFVATTSANEWVHDVTSDHYTPVTQMSEEHFKELVAQHPFIKLSLHTPIAQLQDAVSIWQQQFQTIITILA